jgi:predicted Zn-dependent peptidase
VNEVVAIIDAITPADLKRVAEDVLAQPIRMAIIGPFDADGAFRSTIGA